MRRCKTTAGLLMIALCLNGLFSVPAQTARIRKSSRPVVARQAPPPLLLTPTATRETLAAASLGGASLPFRVLLPADYATSARRYPVLYLLHGLYGNEDDWLTRTNLALYATRYHLIIVMPGVGNSWYANSAGDANARYEDVIIRDLIPHVDARYRTLASWYGRAIAGLSMGGLGAMKFALHYPEQFAFAASFSGAFDAPRTDMVSGPDDQRAEGLRRIFGAKDSEVRRANDVFALLEQLKPEHARLPYLYLAVGTSDPLSSVMPANARFADVLRAHKVQYEYHERPGTHDWRFWDAEIRSALERMSDFIPETR